MKYSYSKELPCPNCGKSVHVQNIPFGIRVVDYLSRFGTGIKCEYCGCAFRTEKPKVEEPPKWISPFKCDERHRGTDKKKDCGCCLYGPCGHNPMHLDPEGI